MKRLVNPLTKVTRFKSLCRSLIQWLTRSLIQLLKQSFIQSLIKLPSGSIFAILILCAGGLNVGCVGAPPKDDYNIAFAAIQGARVAEAQRYSPGLLSQAENFYRQAIVDYEDRRYTSARANFNRAKSFAEKAENISIFKRAKLGE